MTRATNLHDKTQQLLRDGYCVLERILTPEMLVRVLDASEGLIAAQPRRALRKIQVHGQHDKRL